jgi:hypothetical protein
VALRDPIAVVSGSPKWVSRSTVPVWIRLGEDGGLANKNFEPNQA